MMKEFSSWSEFRDIALIAKGMSFDFLDKGSSYEMWTTEQGITYSISIAKPSDDATEFDADWKALGNKPNAPLATIAEETPGKKTGGHFGRKTLECSVPSGDAGDWTDFSFTFPHPISLLSAGWPAIADNDNDEVVVKIAPDTICGAIVAGLTAGVKVLSVSSTVLSSMKVGYAVEVTDGTNTDSLGYCTKVDKVAGTIEVSVAPVNSFTAGSYVSLTIEMVPWMRLKGSGFYVNMGESKIGGSYLPTGTPVVIRYRNNGTTARKFTVDVEYLY